DRTHPAPTLGEAGAPVAAGVVVGPDRALRLADDQHRPVADAVLDVVADAGELLEPARHEPRAGEQQLELEPEVVDVEVAALRDERRPQAVALGDTFRIHVAVEARCRLS